MGNRKKKGRCVKRNKQINVGEKEELVKAPHSFVFHRGLPGERIVELTKDFRKVMEPFTASSLKARKKNTVKDFVSVASVLHVSHMCIFTKTELGMYLKICKLPRGPTLTFKIHSFSLARDVVSMLKKQLVYEEAFKTSPLLVLNNFSGEGMQLKLIASTFQNMFPTINLTTVNLSTIRRCICLNYNATSKTIDFRHYAIKVVPVGLSRGVEKIVRAKVPNLSKCRDIAEFLTKPIMSESEAEDDESTHVTLSQELSSRGNHANCKSAIRLSELGPRITLQLIKVENGLLDGEILFHELVRKTEKEKLAIKKKREEKKKLKEKRKRLQEENRKKKDAQKQERKEKSWKGILKKKLKEKRKRLQEENRKKKDAQKQERKEKSWKGILKKKENDMLLQKIAKESAEKNQVEDDDAQYYREEVGEEPDKDLFQAKVGTKRPRKHMMRYKPKKAKLDES